MKDGLSLAYIPTHNKIIGEFKIIDIKAQITRNNNYPNS